MIHLGNTVDDTFGGALLIIRMGSTVDNSWVGGEGGGGHWALFFCAFFWYSENS